MQKFDFLRAHQLKFARCNLKLLHHVLQTPDPLDPHLDLVTPFHRPDAGRRAGDDQVTGMQRHDLRNEADEKVGLENELRSPRGLTLLSIEIGLNKNIIRIEPGLDPGPDGAEGVE